MSDSSQPAPVSKQRLQEARRAGYTPRSPELTVGVVFLTAAWIGQICLPALVQAFRDLVESGFRHPSLTSFDIMPGLQPAALRIGREVLRIGSACWIAAVATDLAQVGFVWSPLTALPQVERISPVSGWGRLLSWTTFERASLLTLKILASLVALTLISDFAMRSIFSRADIDASGATTLWNTGIHWMSILLAIVGGGCLLSGLVDGWIRKRRWQLSIEKTEDERRRGD